MMVRKSLLAGLVVVAFGAGAAVTGAHAAQPPSPAVENPQRISAQERQLLNRLSPQARQEVMSRMGGGQTVEGIIETMVLNQLSHLAATTRVVDVNVYQGYATLVDANGQQRTVPFTVEQVVLAPEGSGSQVQGTGGAGTPSRTGTSQTGSATQQQARPSPSVPGGQPTPYPTGLGQGDRGLGATSEGNMGPRERGLGEHRAP